MERCAPIANCNLHSTTWTDVLRLQITTFTLRYGKMCSDCKLQPSLYDMERCAPVANYNLHSTTWKNVLRLQITTFTQPNDIIPPGQYIMIAYFRPINSLINL